MPCSLPLIAWHKLLIYKSICILILSLQPKGCFKAIYFIQDAWKKGSVSQLTNLMLSPVQNSTSLALSGSLLKKQMYNLRRICGGALPTETGGGNWRRRREEEGRVSLSATAAAAALIGNREVLANTSKEGMHVDLASGSTELSVCWNYNPTVVCNKHSHTTWV